MTATVTNSGFASKGDATEVRNYPFYKADGSFNYQEYEKALKLQKELSCEFNFCASSIMQCMTSRAICTKLRKSTLMKQGKL
jgi:hypothetical protein